MYKNILLKLYIFVLTIIKDGFATLELLADHSENPKHDFEKTGERKFGGVCGFVGNTCLIVEDRKSGYSLLGGYYNPYGVKHPLAYVIHFVSPFYKYNDSVGWLELKK